MNKRSDRRYRAAISLLLGLTGASLAVGQSSAPESKEGATLLERVMVTGSNIPTEVGDIAIPVTTIDAQEIARSGIHTNFLELIQKESPLFSGNGNLGDTNANSNAASTMGASRIQMRNLDTLVLLDGRRVAESASAARSGVGAFTDVNMIPLEAIDRIEIVSDGASAIYGSDAVGGVVNIILKSNYKGGELGSTYAFSTRDGNYTEKSAYAISGAGDDKLNIMGGFTYAKSDPLFQNQRPFSFPITGKAGGSISGTVNNGAYILNSSLKSPSDKNPTGLLATAPDFPTLVANGTYVAESSTSLDISPYVTEVLGQKRKSGYAKLNASLLDNKKLDFFAEFVRSESDTMSQLAATGVTYTVPAGSPYNPTTANASLVGFRYINLPRQFLNEAGLSDYTIGLKGEITPKWTWELFYKGSNSKETELVTNVVYGPNLARAVAGGYDKNGNVVAGGNYSRVYNGLSTSANWVYQPALDIFARGTLDPASLANLFGVSRGYFWSDLYTTNLNVHGDVYDLPAGTISVAFGGDYREEKVKGLPDDNSRTTGPTAGSFSGISAFDPFAGSRSVSSAFAEVKIPITSSSWNFPALHSLEADAAYRAENYSDAGHSEAPKLTLLWQPIDEQMSFRYTHSKSFTAPALYSSSGPVLQGFTASSTLSSLFGVNGQASLRSGSNPSLRPSHTTSDSWAAVFQPKAIKGLRFDIDYIEIKQRDYVSSIGSLTILQNVDQLGTASPYANRVAFNGFPGSTGATAITGPGQINAFLHTAGNAPGSVYVVDQTVNIGGIKVRAVDLSLSYNLTTQNAGTFDFSSRGTFFIDYQFQAIPTEPYYEYAGAATYGGSGSSGTMPGYKFFTELSWHKESLGLTLANTYIPGVDDIGPGGSSFVTNSTLKRIPVASYSAWDLILSYEFKFEKNSMFAHVLSGSKLSAGVNNLTDKMPPQARQAFIESNADISTYSPIGRLFYVSAEKKF